jgi:hypothetical protein
MDESHNIRAEKSLKAINSLRPVLGLEFTATPKAANVIYAFSLRQATNEGGPNGGGLVKYARVIARRDDDSLLEEREDIKLRDGMRIHERKKTLLITYCKNNGLTVVKPRVLICAPPSQKNQEQKHIERIAEYVQSDTFFGGVYKGKVLAVHQGSDDEQIQQLLDLEKTNNDIEIVIHVNKLKEGWDVKTVYTIIPLRASVSDILTVQTIGRGLRLPFGRQVSHDPGLSEEERKELLDIDTLEIISHEKYSAVLAKVKADPDWDVSVASELEPDNESKQIDPDGAEEYRLEIPIIDGKIHSEEEIDLTNIDIEPRLEKLQDLDVRLVGTELATFEERDYDRILDECKGSLINFFVRILIEETDEFDIRDKKKLQGFVQKYIDKAQVADGEKQEVLFKNRGKIARDIISQIREKIEEKTSIDYFITDKFIEFRSYWRNMPRGYVEKNKDAVIEEELTHNIIGGYTKTIFSRNIFESKQEKWLADILARDEGILRWVRPPTGQVPIAYKGGNYNPDFMVESKGNRFFVLEVKARNEITDKDVQAKARAGVAWCMYMSKATGKVWEYKLIPHDTIQPTASFKGAISNTVVISEKTNGD